MALELLLFGWGSIKTLRTFRHSHEVLRTEAAGGAALALSPFDRQLEHAARTLGKERSQVEQVVRHWMFERPLKWVARAKRQPLLDAISAFKAGGGKTALVSDYPASGKLRALGAA